ncbi:hypothetical protein AAVH_21876 [Aphelenchoides avenae]|nr:hypothetical protein AAVH_21876 [Aphelenchus avenae]
MRSASFRPVQVVVEKKEARLAAEAVEKVARLAAAGKKEARLAAVKEKADHLAVAAEEDRIQWRKS